MLSPDYMRLVRLRLVGFQTGMKCLYETGLNSVPVHMVRNHFIFKNPMGMLWFLYNLPAWFKTTFAMFNTKTSDWSALCLCLHGSPDWSKSFVLVGSTT